MRRRPSPGIVLVLGALVTGCPSPAGDDAGNDAGPSDAAAVDTSAPDIGFDSGCATPCGAITVEGTCQGSVLRFCDNNCLVERDCATAANGPYTCGEYGAFYECLAGVGQACEPDYWNCDPATTCNGHFPCDEASGLVCSGATSPVCATAGSDAGTPDSAATSDTSVVDAGTPDTATAPDTTSAPDTATVPDTAVVEDSAVVADSATVEDSAVVVDSAAVEDSAVVEDAASGEDTN